MSTLWKVNKKPMMTRTLHCRKKLNDQYTRENFLANNRLKCQAEVEHSTTVNEVYQIVSEFVCS